MKLYRAKYDLEQYKKLHDQLYIPSNLNYYSWLKEQNPIFNWDSPYATKTIDYVEHVINGDIRYLMVLMPPRTGKSELLTIRLPAYLLEKYPDYKLIMGAYNQDLAEEFSYQTREIIVNHNKIPLIRDRSRLNDWKVQGGGGLRSAGVGKGVTGRGANGIIIDDPIKDRMEADSETYRNNTWRWYTNVLYTRLQPYNGIKGWIILVMTPWHHDDLAHRILNSSQAKDWVVVKFPAIAKECDPLGRKPGEALVPDRHPIEDLIATRELLGRDFQALYQLDPSPDEGNIINPKDFIEYEHLQLTTFTLQVWDTAFKEKEQNDFSVGYMIKVSKNGYYITERKKGKWAIDQLKFEVQDWAKLHQPQAIIIEDAASGQSIIQSLKISSEFPIIGIAPRKYGKDKVERAHNANDSIKAGRVYIPKFAPWKNDALTTIQRFPNDEHDDDVDALCLGINYLAKRFANTFPIYENFNDIYHMQSLDDIANEQYISIYISMFLDTMATAVCCGITQYGHIVVLDEFVSTSGIDDLASQIDTYKKMLWSAFEIRYVVYTERTDGYWRNVLENYNIEYGHIGKPSFDELTSLVRERLDLLIRKKPALTVVSDNCPKIIEGFRGAYSYKSRDDTEMLDYTPSPVLNIYARLHLALQAAIYQYEFEFGESSK